MLERKNLTATNLRSMHTAMIKKGEVLPETDPASKSKSVASDLYRFARATFNADPQHSSDEETLRTEPSRLAKLAVVYIQRKILHGDLDKTAEVLGTDPSEIAPMIEEAGAEYAASKDFQEGVRTILREFDE